jgi:flagellar basal-body rod protein FlgG
LHIAASGELITAAGFPLRDAASGHSIRATSTKPLEISKDGAVHQDGQVIGQLDIVDFKSTDSLKKLKGAIFQNTDVKNTPAAAGDVTVEQGKVETSNVAVPEAAMRMVDLMRQFEMLQKTVLTNAEMDKKAIEEVARVA